MGIRFNCPACDRALNIKEELAGKRGICPYCKGKIEIPTVLHERPAADAAQRTSVRQAQANAPAVSENAPAAPPGSMNIQPNQGVDARQAAETLGMAQPPAATAGGPAGASPGLAACDAVPPPAATPVAGASTPAPAATAPTGTAAAGAGTAAPAAGATPGMAAAGEISDPIAAAPQLRWYVLPPGSTSQYGPASGGELVAWIQQGRVPPESFVWREDWTEWKVAGRVLPQLGATGLPLPPALQTTAALPLAAGHLPTAAGPAPAVATHSAMPQAIPAGLPLGQPAAASAALPQGVPIAPQAVPIGPQGVAGAHGGGLSQVAVAAPAGALLVGAGASPVAAGAAVPTVSTSSRYAASRVHARRRSKRASLIAIIVLVLAIAALTPLVIKVVFYP